MADFSKCPFSKTTNSWNCFAKISQIGPLVSKIDWCKGHWCSSTYMVVRLSDIRAKTGKNCIFCVFRLFLPLCQTASRPYRLSNINALRIISSYEPKDQSQEKNFKKKMRIGGAGKWAFFRRPFWILFFPKKFFYFFSFFLMKTTMMFWDIMFLFSPFFRHSF